MKADLLVVRDLIKNYLIGTPLEAHVLKGITFSVSGGEIVAIL